MVTKPGRDKGPDDPNGRKFDKGGQDVGPLPKQRGLLPLSNHIGLGPHRLHFASHAQVRNQYAVRTVLQACFLAIKEKTQGEKTQNSNFQHLRVEKLK